MKNFFTSLCLVLIAFGSTNFIKNSGKTAKMTRFVFALCLLCSFISVLPTVDIEKFSVNASVNYENDTLTISAFRACVADLLEKENVSFEKIEIISTEKGENGINIEGIRVDGATDKKKAEEVLAANIKTARIEVN